MTGAASDAQMPGSPVNTYEPGTAVYVRLLLSGAEKTAKAVVVDSAGCQTVVACPEECACGPDATAWQVFSCAAVERDASCGVVFYSVGADSLTVQDLEGACAFKTSDGSSATPAAQSLLDAFHEEACWDSLQIATVQPSEVLHRRIQEVGLCSERALFVHNSVLVIPNLLTQEERHVLIDAADRCARRGSDSANFYSYQQGLNRFPVRKLDLEAQMLSSSIFTRLLSLFEAELPDVAEELFEERSELNKLKLCFSPGEPAVNIYTEGGAFSRHTDNQSVTLNVLLSEPGAFSGGGTMFWPQCGHEDCSKPVVLRPQPGTALLFNGSVEHAGRAVHSGIRHVFVASFNLFNLG